ncbi:hypothetical protein LCGC14_1750050 [marine sediment metagenome]|uniref:Uncharacterized protein n=1 Tax=marine sediment metagenome TaxID=412755 RepID=A0A0F9H485_9ZZZZ
MSKYHPKYRYIKVLNNEIGILLEELYRYPTKSWLISKIIHKIDLIIKHINIEKKQIQNK